MFQAIGIHEALENENRIRKEYSSASMILYSFSDLKLGAQGDLTKISQGRRFKLILGEQGVSRFTYKAVLLDAHEHSGPFMYNYGVFLVQKVCDYVLIWFACGQSWFTWLQNHVTRDDRVCISVANYTVLHLLF